MYRSFIDHIKQQTCLIVLPSQDIDLRGQLAPPNVVQQDEYKASFIQPPSYFKNCS